MGLLDSWWYVAFVAIFVFCVLLYEWIFYKLKYFEYKNLPYIRYDLNSFLNGLKSGKSLSLSDWLDEKYRQYPNEPFIGFFCGITPCLLLRDPSTIENITQNNFKNFEDRWRCGINELIDPLWANPFYLNGEKWKELRALITPGFSALRLQDMFPIMQSCANSLCQYIRKKSEPDKDFDANQLFISYMFSTIASIGYGLEQEDIKNCESELKNMLNKFSLNTLLKKILLMIKLETNYMGSLFRLTLEDVQNYFLELTKTQTMKRKNSAISKHDFLHNFLEMKISDKNTAASIKLNDEILTAQLMMLFYYGMDKNRRLLTTLCYFMAKNKKIQDNVRNELKLIKKKYSVLNYDAIEQLTLLDKCITESLRLYPITGSLIRTCNKNFILENGYVVERGVKLIIPIRSIHNDPKYWIKPETFDPERWTKFDLNHEKYLPFGKGPRACIGETFSRLQVKTTIAKILENFELYPKTIEPLRRGKILDDGPINVFVRFHAVDQTTL